MTAPNHKKLLQGLGYVGFFLVCFGVSLLITFPYERLATYVETRLQQSMGMRVTIEGLRPTVTGALLLRGVTLGPSLTPRPGSSPSTNPFVRIDEAVVRMSLLSYLFGTVDTSFSVELGGGEAEGSLERNEERLALDLSFSDIRAKSFPVLQEKVGLPVEGVLSGDIELVLPSGKADESSGSFELALRDGVIGDGKARLSLGKLMGFGGAGGSDSDEGMVIQPIKLGPLGLKSKLVKGQLDIPHVSATSPDAELSLEGEVHIEDPLPQTRFDTYLTVKLTESYAARDEQTKTLLTLADTVGRSAKRPDGSFGFRLSGSLLRGVSFRPSSNFTSGSSSARSPRRPGFPSRPSVDRTRPGVPPPRPSGDDLSGRPPNLPSPGRSPLIAPPPPGAMKALNEDSPETPDEMQADQPNRRPAPEEVAPGSDEATEE